MNKLLVICTIVLVLPILSFASSVGDKAEGHIVLDNGKKLEGKIIIGTLIDNEVKVKFISKNSRTRKVYYPKDVQSYAYQVDDIDEMGRKVKIWVRYERQKVDQPPKPFGPTLVFMQSVEEGTVHLFSYFYETPLGSGQDLLYVYYLELDNGLVQRVSDNTFERVAKSVFKEYPALTNRIGSDDFLYRNLDQIVRDFNFWMVNKHDKNEYRMALEPRSKF